tara:strand:+ start:120 stop:830 length:711 start_codon:yes stop_codon:yes gene_type:complete
MSGSINEFTNWLGTPAGRKVVQQVMEETNLRPEKYNKDINDVIDTLISTVNSKPSMLVNEDVAATTARMLPEIISSISKQRYKPRNPIGRIELPDGTTYVGELRNGRPHGKGVQYSIPIPPNETGELIYNGFWMDGQKDGFGFSMNTTDKIAKQEFYRPITGIEGRTTSPQEGFPSSGEYRDKHYQLREMLAIIDDIEKKYKKQGKSVSRAERKGGKKKTKRRLKKNKSRRKSRRN